MKPNPANGRHQALKRGLDDVVEAAENLLRATTGEAVAEYGDVRKKVDASVRAARSRIAAQAEEFVDDARTPGAGSQRLVQANPWASMGVGAVVGLVAGVLLARR